jgi:hypothetical protein
MRLYPDPVSMTPDERFGELSHILAAALLRRRVCPVLPDNPAKHPNPKNLPKTGQDCLEVPTETVLSVHTG